MAGEAANSVNKRRREAKTGHDAAAATDTGDGELDESPMETAAGDHCITSTGDVVEAVEDNPD
jgi:hypothetical protein